MRGTLSFIGALVAAMSSLAGFAQAPAAPTPGPAPRNAAPAAPPAAVEEVATNRSPAPGAPNAQGRGGRGPGEAGQNPPGPPIPVIEPITSFTAPASMELLLPAGATATIDGTYAGTQRTFEFNKFDANGVQRVEVVVKFADDTEVKRAVDLRRGSRVRVPVNLPPIDQPSTVLIDATVAVLWASFSPDGRLVATAADNGAVVLWDLTLGRPVRNFPGHRDGVNSVVFSPDGEQLLTASNDSLAILWHVGTGRVVRRFSAHTGAVTSAVFSTDGKKIVTGSADKTAVLWDALTGAKLRVFTGHTDEVVTVAFSPDGLLVATGSADKHALLWNVETGEKVNSLRTIDTVSGIAFSPDGKTLAASNFSNHVNLWEAATGKPIAMTRRVNLDLNGIAFTPDSRFIFTAGKDATAKLWDGNSLQQLREFAGHGTFLQSVAVSPDGRLLLTSSYDGTVRIYDVATGTELVALATSNNGRDWAAVGPDGLFDGSEAGRRMIGYRFSSKLPGASVDQFFGQYFRPGLVAELFRGERPMAAAQLGRKLPPVLKIVSPKVRSTSDVHIAVDVEAIDKGGGVSSPQIYNNGARLAIEPAVKREGDVVRFSFPVSLAAGSNQLRVTAATDDGSWEGIPVELALNCTYRPERKGRLFVVAMGIGDSSRPSLEFPQPIADAQVLGALLQRRGAALYDRVDVVSVLGKDATRARMKETMLDLAHLSQPHDTVVLVVCGRGELLDGRLYFSPPDFRYRAATNEDDLRRQGLNADDLAELLGAAIALNRVLVLDASAVAPERRGEKASAGFALRAAVERWSRTHGVHAIAACAGVTPQSNGASAPGLLTGLLLDAAGSSNGAAAAPTGREASNAIGVTDWFNNATDRASVVTRRLGLDPQVVQASTRSKGFPLLAATR